MEYFTSSKYCTTQINNYNNTKCSLYDIFSQTILQQKASFIMPIYTNWKPGYATSIGSHFKNINVVAALRILFSKPETTCSKLTIETLEQGVKYVQS